VSIFGQHMQLLGGCYLVAGCRAVLLLRQVLLQLALDADAADADAAAVADVPVRTPARSTCALEGLSTSCV
jgi:hypothetical protein